MTSTCPTVVVRCCRIALLAGIGAAIPLLNAQPAPASSVSAADLAKYDTNRNGVLDAAELAARAADTTKEEAIVLTPFEVSTDKDRGYFGGSTLAGGRADTPLKFTPASISVMTKEFLEDFDLTDMNQALAWTVGADAPTGGESGAFGGNRFQTSFRGVDGGGNFPVRNGSINYYVADTYNSERYDFSRGPNAALFGDGGPGGLQGSTSKRARYNSTAVTTTTRIDNFGSYRATADFNYGLNRVAFRLNLLHQNVKGYQDGTSNKQNGLTLAASYKITDKTQFSMEVQRDAERNVAYRTTYGENASRWDRVTVNNDNSTIAAAAATAGGISQISANTDYLVWNFGTNSFLNYRGNQYQTIGLGYQIPWGGRPDLPNFKPGVDKEFFLGPADAIIDRDFNAQSFWLDHTFSRNLAIQFGIVKNDGDPHYINTQSVPGDYRIDVNRLLPTGAVNPNFGKAYSDFDQSYQYQQDRVREYKFSGVYRFEIPRAFDLKQRFNLNLGWRRTTFEALNSSWRRTNNAAVTDPTNAANQYRFRVYWDQPRQSTAPFVPLSVPGFDFKLTETGGNINQRTITYGQLVSQSTFFNERLALTASVRRDKVEGDFFNRLRTDPVTLKNIGGFNGVDGLHLYRKRWQTSPNAGIVLYPFQGMNKWIQPIGFVANYSTNFTQISSATTPLISGDDPPLTNSTTKDWGVRYAMGEGTAYLTVSHYNTTQENQLGGWGTRGNFQNLYTALGYTDPVFTGSTGFNYQDVSSRKLEGWEVELQANPTNNISLTANYSHPLVYQVFESRDRRAFFEANQAYYQQAARASVGQVVNGVAVLSPTDVQTNAQAIEDSLNGTTAGTLANNLERHRINLSARYSFTEGRLRGFVVNGGINYRAHKKVGSRDARIKFQTVNPTIQQTTEAAYDYLWVDPTWSTTLGANYTRRFGKYTARFQINITNVLNDDDPQWTSYGLLTAGQLQNLTAPAAQGGANALTVAGGNPRMQVLNGFRQLEPRKIAFTTTLSF